MTIIALAALATACGRSDGYEEAGKVTSTYSDGFLWTDPDTAWSEPKTMSLKFNNDALAKSAGLGLRVVDSEGQPIGDEALQVEVDGSLVGGNVIGVMPEGKLTADHTLRFRFLPGVDEGRHELHLKIEPCGIARVNHEEVSRGQELKVILPVYYSVVMNPLKKGLLIALAVFVAGVLLARSVLHRKKFVGSPKKIVSVRNKEDGVVFEPRTVDMKGCVQVLFTSKQLKQSRLDRFFRGKVLYVFDPAFTSDLKLTPGKKRGEINVSGPGYFMRSTSMQYSDGPFTAEELQSKNKVELS